MLKYIENFATNHVNALTFCLVCKKEKKEKKSDS